MKGTLNKAFNEFKSGATIFGYHVLDLRLRRAELTWRGGRFRGKTEGPKSN
jgi:hypothetical protein